MLKQRVLTAAVLLPVALIGFFLLDGFPFALFFGAVVSVGAWEWARLAGLLGQVERIGYAVAVGLALLVLWSLPMLAAPVIALGLLWWVAATYFVITYPDSSRLWGGRPGALAIGLLVLIPAWQALVLLKIWPMGNWLIVAVMALVWVADIGAYFSGRRFGRRKLAPAVSPGKSWEGLIGGLLASLVATLGVALWQGWSGLQLSFALVAAALVVLVSVVGDLSESMFKRKAGIKDSSQLLPGHGGVLDRIDSLTAAVPMFCALLWLVGWNG